MEIKKVMTVECTEPISKAASHLEENPAVIVTKDGKYYGMIDDHAIDPSLKNPQTVKCENMIIRPPVLKSSATIIERITAFSVGHFKALPVVQEQTVMGVTTRTELLADLRKEGLLPNIRMNEVVSSPVYTIEQTETIGKAKTMMKENDTRRLLVTRNGYPQGILSAFEIATWSGHARQAGGRMDRGVTELQNLDSMPIVGFLRADLTSVDEGASLEEAVDKMIKNHVSHATILSNKKAVGMISALDIFKLVKEGGQSTENTITISGLHGDSASEYQHVNDKIGHVIEKFRKSFTINSIAVHVKEQKSTYIVNLYLETGHGGHVSIKDEAPDLTEAVDRVAVELSSILRKEKEKNEPKQKAIRRGR
ncbi:CBS domain-containing protein [Candidatus Micrarchaeota archaeon]|nr:CBS domain-containing protein [Candidatus Micrarchaeota archaeon]